MGPDVDANKEDQCSHRGQERSQTPAPASSTSEPLQVNGNGRADILSQQNGEIPHEVSGNLESASIESAAASSRACGPNESATEAAHIGSNSHEEEGIAGAKGVADASNAATRNSDSVYTDSGVQEPVVEGGAIGDAIEDAVLPGSLDDFLTNQRRRVEAVTAPRAASKAVESQPRNVQAVNGGVGSKRSAQDANMPVNSKQKRVGKSTAKTPTDPRLVVTFGSDSDDENEVRLRARLASASAAGAVVQQAGGVGLVSKNAAPDGRVAATSRRGDSPTPAATSLPTSTPSPTKPSAVPLTPKALLEKRIALLKQKIQQKQAAAAATGPSGSGAAAQTAASSGVRAAGYPSGARRISPVLSDSVEKPGSEGAPAAAAAAGHTPALRPSSTRSVTPESRGLSPAPTMDGDGRTSRRLSPLPVQAAAAVAQPSPTRSVSEPLAVRAAPTAGQSVLTDHVETARSIAVGKASHAQPARSNISQSATSSHAEHAVSHHAEPAMANAVGPGPLVVPHPDPALSNHAEHGALTRADLVRERQHSSAMLTDVEDSRTPETTALVPADATALGALLSGTAVSPGALDTARDLAERKLKAIRRLMEENLREDLELQMRINRLESSIVEHQQAVMEAQDLLNFELIRSAESGC